MVAQMDAEGFGHCTSHGECEAACPKGISIGFIAKMNRELLTAMATAPNDVNARK
jgi:succinate dehydrogenase / fumarate reductase iron-sulfur subunit